MSEYSTILEQIRDFGKRNLLNNPSVLQYLYDRGISDQSVHDFEIGYFPEGMRELFDIIDARKLKQHKLIHSATRSALQQRVIYPIYSAYGEILALGGRPPFPEKVRINKGIVPKYWNSVYDKADHLFGLNRAIPAIRKYDVCYVGEGNFDVVMAHQCEVQNFVCTSGTLFTEEQITLLARYASRIIAVFDADKAGKNVMDKIKKKEEERVDDKVRVGVELATAELESGEDVDSYLRKYGRDKFLKKVEETLTIL